MQIGLIIILILISFLNIIGLIFMGKGFSCNNADYQSQQKSYGLLITTTLMIMGLFIGGIIYNIYN